MVIMYLNDEVFYIARNGGGHAALCPPYVGLPEPSSLASYPASCAYLLGFEQRS